MIKYRDIILKEIYDSKNKKIGVCRDVYLDFDSQNLTGLLCSKSFRTFKNNFIKYKDIIEIKNKIVADALSKPHGIPFSKIKNMEVIDASSNIIGNVEDLIVDKENLILKGFVISPGFFEKIFTGKSIVLIKDIKYCESYLIWDNKGNKVLVKNLLHKENSYET